MFAEALACTAAATAGVGDDTLCFCLWCERLAARFGLAFSARFFVVCLHSGRVRDAGFSVTQLLSSSDGSSSAPEDTSAASVAKVGAAPLAVRSFSILITCADGGALALPSRLPSETRACQSTSAARAIAWGSSLVGNAEDDEDDDEESETGSDAGPISIAVTLDGAAVTQTLAIESYTTSSHTAARLPPLRESPPV